ncbi:hypothetical protein G210_3536 [Candida maltosa Xu316]|uniref:Uncharacterized protein n=1 Tax=Candida maltosa (strain Xu316) TaxID=1245528 RepID=M3HSE0_CANMX|nr:hypothetical protein G210_3536 [Candida maltosa Xu316]
MIVFKQSKSILNKVLPIDLSPERSEPQQSNSVSRRPTISIHDLKSTNHTNSRRLSHDMKPVQHELHFSSSDEDESSAPPSRRGSINKQKRKSSIRRSESVKHHKEKKEIKFEQKHHSSDKTTQTSPENKTISMPTKEDAFEELSKLEWILIGVIGALLLLIYFVR